MGLQRMPRRDAMTTIPSREVIVQMGSSLGDDISDLMIGILCMDPGLCMSRLPLGFALVFLRTLSRLLLTSTIVDDDRTGGGEGGEVGNMMGSSCSVTATMMTMNMKTTMQRIGRGCTGGKTMGGE
jgi:hypothetical protein